MTLFDKFKKAAKVGGKVAKAGAKAGGLTAACLAGGLLFYFGSLIGIQYAAERNSPRIRDQTHLNEVIKTKRKELGIGDHVYIGGMLYDGYSDVARLKQDMYWLRAGIGTNESEIEGELYQVAGGFLDAKANIENPVAREIVEYFVHKPQVVFFQATGRKL